jgi:hypothetical protein
VGAFEREGGVELWRADGTTLPVEGLTGLGQMASSANYLFAANFGGAPGEDSELRLIERATGDTVWAAFDSSWAWSSAYVDDAGQVVGEQYLGATFETSMVKIDLQGVATPMGAFRPQGPPNDEGWIPGRPHDADGAPTGAGFIHVESGQIVTVLPGDLTGTLLDDGTWVHIVGSGGGTIMAFEAPTSHDEVGIPSVDGTPRVVAASGNWVLAATDTFFDVPPQEIWRVDRDTLTAELIDLAPSPGLQAMHCYGPSQRVDAAGRISTTSRDSGQARVFSREVAGSWQEVGLPVTGIDSVELTTVGETLFIATRGLGQTFCPQQMWTDPTVEALPDVTLQAITPARGGALQLPSSFVDSMSVQAQGECVAGPLQAFGDPPPEGGRQWTIVDVDSGETFDLGAGRVFQWLSPL